MSIIADQRMSLNLSRSEKVLITPGSLSIQSKCVLRETMSIIADQRMSLNLSQCIDFIYLTPLSMYWNPCGFANGLCSPRGYVE